METPVKVKLFIVLGNGYLGPIDLTVWKHQKPEAMTSFQMDGPLAIPPEMQTRVARSLYSVRRNARLHPGATYHDQSVVDGDVFLLTDRNNDQLALATAHSLASQAGVEVVEVKAKETRFKATLRAGLEGIPYAGPALAVLIFGPKAGE